ncbi:Peptidyl-prolyl cis-trans isomerase FKBP62 [Capsicum chinense]|nr:Peptidyl-prolyl cis-trans isomerase FKBP62 [Capsicum chinense]
MGDFNSKKINKVNVGSDIQELPKREIGKGLRKKILQKGNSWKTPFPGDEIQVHYRVKLQDGKYSDSSYDKGKPFTFKLGQGIHDPDPDRRKDGPVHFRGGGGRGIPGNVFSREVKV